MHIVIASVFDPIPSDGISLGRYHFLSMALKEKGHRVTYLTSGFLHTLKSFRNNKEEEIDGIKYIKVPARGYIQNNSLGRLADHFLVAKNAEKIIENIHFKENIDLVLCASPPLFWSNFILGFCKRRKIKSILDIQDNWPKAFEDLNSIIYKTTINALPLQIINKRNIRFADAVTSVTSDYLNTIRDKKTAVFYLGAPVSKIQEKIRIPSKKQTDKLRLVFMGNISTHKYLLDFLNSIQNENIEVMYIGECADERIKRHPLINYSGSLYDEALYNALSENDYGLFINNSYKEIKMPNKLFYYWACGLPVLGIDIKGEASNIIKDMEGFVLNDEPINITYLKNKLIDINKTQIKRKALNLFDEKIIYSSFADFIEEMVKQQ